MEMTGHLQCASGTHSACSEPLHPVGQNGKQLLKVKLSERMMQTDTTNIRKQTRFFGIFYDVLKMHKQRC